MPARKSASQAQSPHLTVSPAAVIATHIRQLRPRRALHEQLRPNQAAKIIPKHAVPERPVKRRKTAPAASSGAPRTTSTNVDVSSPKRPVTPHRTNAPIAVSGGSIIRNPFGSASPSARAPAAVNILKEACAHLVKVEPRLQPLIAQHHCQLFSPEGLAEECKPFDFLCRGIMAQQVSGAAASAIKNKFVALFTTEHEGGQFPTPEMVMLKSIPELRQAGLSERKAEYIKGLAERFASNELSTSLLLNASDEEVMEKLTAVRGLGRWSVEMFACFGLKRMDIFSTGDLGIQRGMAAFYGKDVNKLKAKGGGKWKYMSEQDMLRYAEKFSPFRSVFMWYMWRAEGVDINVVEQK